MKEIKFRKKGDKYCLLLEMEKGKSILYYAQEEAKKALQDRYDTLQKIVAQAKSIIEKDKCYKVMKMKFSSSGEYLGKYMSMYCSLEKAEKYIMGLIMEHDGCLELKHGVIYNHGELNEGDPIYEYYYIVNAREEDVFNDVMEFEEAYVSALIHYEFQKYGNTI